MLANQSIAITDRDNVSKGIFDDASPSPNGILSSPSDALPKWLEQNPEEPALIRYQADALKKKGAEDSAASLYCKAAKLLLEKDRIPAAIALKIMEWRIITPTKSEVENFLSKINHVTGEDQPVRSFFGRLNVQEFVEFYSSFEILQLQPDKVIKKVGDIEDSLNFVITGTLKGSLYHAIDDLNAPYREPNFYLHENDYFGDIYPFDSIKKSISLLETKSQVELLRISKEKLRKICTKYTRIEHGLLNLLKVRSKASVEDSPDRLREARRIPLKLNLGIEILLQGSQNTSIHLTGFTKDVSVGGICFVLDEMGLDSSSGISSFEKLLNYARVMVNIPVEELKVSLPGTVVWLKTVSHEGRKTMALGIQFDQMSPKLKGLMMMFFNSFNEG